MRRWMPAFADMTALIIFLSTSVQAESLEEALAGFEQLDTAASTQLIATEDKAFHWQGFFKLSSNYNTDHNDPPPGQADFRGWSRLRTEADAKLDYDFNSKWTSRMGLNIKRDFIYQLQGRDHYSDELVDEMETEAEFREIYLAGNLAPQLDLKVGRQIVVWGTSDTIRVVDVLNPLDSREIGLVDLEDLRLPIAMSRLDYFQDSWSYSAIAIHERSTDKVPVLGSDYFVGNTPLPNQDQPSNSLTNTEWAMATTGRFNSWDISLHAADFYQRTAHLELVSLPNTIRRHYGRLQMLGSAVNYTQGNWLWKGEAAYIKGLEFFNLPNQDKNRADVMLGLDYLGYANTSIAVELANQHMIDYAQVLKNTPDFVNRDQMQSAWRITKNWFNDRLEVVFLAVFLGSLDQDGSLQRLTFDYEWVDNLHLLVGGIVYHSGNNVIFKEIEDNDRILLEAKYNF